MLCSSGPNGCGKSTFVCAVTLALGGDFRRQEDASAMVARGHDQAKVRVKVARRRGPDRTMPTVYDFECVVIRDPDASVK